MKPVNPEDSIIIDASTLSRPLERNDRLTAQLMLTYETIGDPPIQFSCVFSNMLKSSGGECYTRRIKVEDNWIPLDLGWVDSDKVGLIVLDNQTGITRPSVNPTEEEKKAAAEAVLLMSVGGEVLYSPNWRLSPGRFFCAEPVNANNLFIRSAKGTVKLTIFIVPN